MTEEAAFPNGKGLMSPCTKSNNSHTLCFQGPGSTARRFSAESLVLLPPLVWRRFRGGCAPHVLRVPVPARLWASCCLRRLIPVSGRGKPFGGSVRPWLCTALPPPALPGAERRTDNQVLLTPPAVPAAVGAHSPGCPYTSRRKRPEKQMELVQAEVFLAAVCILC